MSSRNTRELAAYAPDGTEVTWKNAAKWDVVGMVQRTDGTWKAVKHGFSRVSVYDRTHAYYNLRMHLDGLTAMHVADAWEATAPVIRDYKFFGSHRVTIARAFTPGQGWDTRNMYAGRQALRALAADGVTSVEIRGDGHVVEFQMAEILKSMNARKKAAS
jgi:hypothetical protein